MTIRRTNWGTTPGGRKVALFTLAGPNGMEAAITTYGATLVSLKVPDKSGALADIVLGYDSLEGYMQDPYCFGNIIGRFANRISGARFELEGRTYELSRNHGRHHIHGGFSGFDRQVWTAQALRKQDATELKLTYQSAHMEEGYPGRLKATAVYALTHTGELRIAYEAQTDRATIFNPTSHAYFNLNGQGKGDCLAHQLTLKASRFLAIDEESIPTGEIRSAKGTPFDFSAPVTIGKRIRTGCHQLECGHGYDHFLVLDGDRSDTKWAARAYDPPSGRELTLYTTQPGLQFYTGNSIRVGSKGKKGAVYGPRSGFCLETQGYPDAPNQPKFPSVELFPGQRYKEMTRFVFRAVDQGSKVKAQSSKNGQDKRAFSSG